MQQVSLPGTELNTHKYIIYGFLQKEMMNMRIGDIVNVRDIVSGGYWKGKITDIHDGEIIVQDKGINFAELDIDNLIFKNNEYWEK